MKIALSPVFCSMIPMGMIVGSAMMFLRICLGLIERAALLGPLTVAESVDSHK